VVSTPAQDARSVHETLLQEWHQFKEVNELQQKETKQLGEATQETKTLISRLNDRLDTLEAELNRPERKMQNAELGRVQQSEATHAAFVKALRSGIGGLDPEERKLVKMVSLSEAKALALGDDTAGGYLATPEYVQDIIKTVLLFSPIRAYARVVSTNNRSLQIPYRTGVFAAQWVSETGARSETKGLAYGLLDIPNFEMYAEVLASEQMLEDAAFDIAAQISMETAMQFGVTEGKAFISGSAAGQPEGILTNALIPSVVTTTATTVTYTGLVNAFYTLKTAYARDAVWAMQRSTVGLVRQIVDSSNRPLWDPGFPGFSNGQPSTILGAPYFEAPDLPAVATNAYAIVLGNWKMGYYVVDRTSVVVKRLIEKYAETGQIAFLTRKRVGGQVVLPEAFIKLQIHT